MPVCMFSTRALAKLAEHTAVSALKHKHLVVCLCTYISHFKSSVEENKPSLIYD